MLFPGFPARIAMRRILWESLHDFSKKAAQVTLLVIAAFLHCVSRCVHGREQSTGKLQCWSDRPAPLTEGSARQFPNHDHIVSRRFEVLDETSKLSECAG